MSYLGVGCGGNDEGCDPVARTGCDTGQSCEVVEGGDPACFESVFVKGKVFNFDTQAAVVGARVVAIDVNGTPVSSVAVTDDNGNYALNLPASRNADGTVIGADITLRADAQGYETFPRGVRQPVPVDTTAPTDTDDGLIVQSLATDVALFPLPDAGTGRIHGKVEVPSDHVGVLVVAEAGGVGYSAVADREGDYVIFNLPVGGTSVTAYAKGENYNPIVVDVADMGNHEANLSIADQNTGTVNGTIMVVNPEGAAGVTSIVLAVTSTFDDLVARGEVPPGIRVPPPPEAGNVSSNYTFEGVPAGSYTVLAAFENDGLVRDPDISIGGTSILDISVTAGGTTTVEGFKITGALEVIGPGADRPEVMTTAPTFSWVDDSSEDHYLLEVFDSYGNVIWSVEEPGHSGSDPAVAYGGPALTAGMVYQFRATSFSGAGVPISRTEDLRGVFTYAP